MWRGFQLLTQDSRVMKRPCGNKKCRTKGNEVTSVVNLNTTEK
jgi:hypothetical protein